VKIADPVVEREIGSGFGTGLDLLNGSQIDFDGFSPVFLLLELPRRILQLFQVHAARGRRGKRGLTREATERYRAVKTRASTPEERRHG